MTDKERLTILQMLGNRPKSNSAHLKKVIRELSNSKFSWAIDRLKASNEELPTDYQNSHFYNIIETSFSILEKIVNDNDILFNDILIETKPIPTFGTVDQNSPNVFIDLAEDSTTIIFSEGLLKFTQRLLHLLVNEEWLLTHNLMTKKHQELLTKNFLDIMMCFYLFSDAYTALPLEWCEAETYDNLDSQKIYDLESAFDIIHYEDDDYLIFENSVSTTAYLWMAAHEYSHLLLNHKDCANKWNNCPSENNSWEAEFDADLLGSIITMNSSFSYSATIGIYFALSCIYMSSFNLDENGHPPALLRIQRFLDYITTKQAFSNNHKVIDAVFSPKIREFTQFLHAVENQNIYFSTPLDLQRFIYKEYDLHN